jgi:hypothetical protein
MRTNITAITSYANALAAAISPTAFIILLIPYGLRWGLTSLLVPLHTPILSALIFSAATILGIAAHEALHVVGFVMFGHAPWREVRVGIKRSGIVTPFARCHATLTISAYRHAALLPGVTLGLIPGSTALVSGNGWLALWSALMGMGALGDVATFWLLRNIPSSTRICNGAIVDEGKFESEGAGKKI